MISAFKRTNRVVDGKYIDTITLEFLSACIIEVEAGTTGYKGGDSGHGGRSYIRIKDLGSTDIRVNLIEDKYGAEDGVELIFGGDCEMSLLPEIFRAIANILESKPVIFDNLGGKE